MPGVMVMSIQIDSSPIDNLMSSLMSPLVNNIFNSINPNIPQMSRISMPQISSNPENFLYLNYE